MLQLKLRLLSGEEQCVKYFWSSFNLFGLWVKDEITTRITTSRTAFF